MSQPLDVTPDVLEFRVTADAKEVEAIRALISAYSVNAAT